MEKLIVNNYGSFDVTFEKSKGSTMWDVNGKKYIDFIAGIGVNCLGHNYKPLVKAIYLLFLSHPEGIVLKCLPDYRRELKDIYNLVRPQGLTDRAEKSIINATNPVQNSINEKCARIRKAFSCVLPHRLVKYYAISGKRGEVKKVSLQRDRICWEVHLKRPQGL